MSAVNKFSLSFEFFPPKTTAGQDKFSQTIKILEQLNPEYFSVTFGAGGSDQTKTVDTVSWIQQQSKISVTPHITCIGTTKNCITDLLRSYAANNIRSLVALRGDLPPGTYTGDFAHANELVAYIRQTTGDFFQIDVAAYPECHPESNTPELELQHFMHKVNAGANGAITQYFYNVDAYQQFLHSSQKLGLKIPLTPGIMPITNNQQLRQFSERCGAEVPRWICKHLDAYQDNNDQIFAFGVEVVSALCEKLLKAGAPGLHFYTLNKAEASIAICRNLGIACER